MAGPIETKVSAAAVASALTGLGLWALQTYVFPGTTVPLPVIAAVQTIVPAAVTFLAGYLAPHTPRLGPIVEVETESTGRHADDGETTDIPVRRFTDPKG